MSVSRQKSLKSLRAPERSSPNTRKGLTVDKNESIEKCISITQKHLKELLSFDPNTGIFTWLVSSNKKIKIGDVAGYCDFHGYIVITVYGIKHKAHRLAWLYVYGSLPPNEIDHINKIKHDNRIYNLRIATKSENQWNHGKNINNTSGYKGVGWDKRRQKWRSYIRVFGKQNHLGYFDTKEEAYASYCVSATESHGKFAHLG